MKNTIRDLRKVINITQQDLAKSLGVNRQTIISIEKGTYDPSLKLAFKIANYFKRDIKEIFIFESG